MRPRARAAATAVLAVAAFVLADLVLCRTGTGQRFDNALFSGILEGTPEAARRLLAVLARPALPVGLAVLLVVLSVRALRSSPRAVLVAALGLGSVPLARAIRSTWTRPDLGVPGYLDNTFPSTHATAGIALLLGCLTLWPRPIGRAEAWGAAILAAVLLLGNVTWYAHRPADVIGSALLAVAVPAFAAALLGQPLIRLAAPVGDSRPARTTRGGATHGR